MTGLCLLLEKLLTSPPPTPPSSTASADAQSCPHLDTSWQGGQDSSMNPAPPSPPDVRAPSYLAPPPWLLSKEGCRDPQVLQNQNWVVIRMATLPESSFHLPFPFHLETNVRFLLCPLSPGKVFSLHPSSTSPRLPGCSSGTPVLCQISPMLHFFPRYL